MNEVAAGSGEAAQPRLIPSAEPVFEEMIPGLRRLADAYRVNTSEVDAEILELFVAEIRKVAASLQQAVAAKDWGGIRWGAHSLQGMGGTIGAPELSVVGVEMSSAAKREDAARCASLLGGLQEWMRRMEPDGTGGMIG